MSLRDQLLKSGLASKQQAKKAARQAKKNQHKKQKALAKGDTSSELLQKDDIQKKIESDKQKQKELDLQKNRELLENQKSFQATSIIYSQGTEERGGPIAYYFKGSSEKRIEVIYVSSGQQKVLSTGKLGIATLNNGKWYLLGKEDCHKVKALKPELLVCLHEEKPLS